MSNHNVRFVVFRYQHHSPHSGYSRLAEYGAAHFAGETIPVAKPLSRRVIRQRMLWRLARGTPGYDRAAMAAELKVAWRLLRERETIFHFLYGETTYHYTGHLNRTRDNRLVATFHLPPAGIRRAVQIEWHIQQLSAIVCVGRNQQDYFAEFYDPDKIFFVPLGVDTEYFTPPDPSYARDPDLCLFVGQNYRDFPTLRGVIELVSYRRPETRFVAVMPPQSYELVGEHPNLAFRSGVPETELREMYRSAALMVMPLKDATANNALLEGMACGLPLVVTDVGATRDYVCPESTALVPLNDSQGMAEVVTSLLENPEERRRMSEGARKRALEFSWPRVVEQLESVYDEVS